MQGFIQRGWGRTIHSLEPPPLQTSFPGRNPTLTIYWKCQQIFILSTCSDDAKTLFHNYNIITVCVQFQEYIPYSNYMYQVHDL